MQGEEQQAAGGGEEGPVDGAFVKQVLRRLLASEGAKAAMVVEAWAKVRRAGEDLEAMEGDT